jgi:cobyrinic acid a,c-diamide synthase
MNALVIAGTTSGVGKTTVAVGLMAALKGRGLSVQPFKTGPDYIDPSLHTYVTGQVSRNLDTWMLGRDIIIELFNRAMPGKDIAIVEGVMGLYDGHSSTDEDGSTAELAKLLGAPVILVVDSRKGARSLAAMVAGYKSFDPDVRLAGVILNGIGGERHLRLCTEAIEHYTGVPVVGHLPRREELSLPERHLGLVPTAEKPLSPEYIARLAQQYSETFDVPQMLRLAEEAQTPGTVGGLFPTTPIPPIVKVAVARDSAFSFYYQDALDLLEAMGARILEFSPLNDANLPAGTDGIYIGGGFPELYAAQLAANVQLKHEVRQSIERGMPVYAECGGLMYLGESLRDFQGREFEMVGSLPISSRIDNHRLSLGYRTVRAIGDGPLLRAGETVRGHEFHWSVLDRTGEANAYGLPDKGDMIEGYQAGGLLASYIHLHLCSSPGMAARFVEECARWKSAL